MTHWKKLGLLVMKGRLVDVAASEALLDSRPISKRGRGTNRRPDAPVAPVLAEVPREVLEATPRKVLTSAANWTTAEATRRKEIALALTRQLEYDLKSGAVVQIDEVKATVEAEYSIVRDRILQAPSKLADRLLDCPDRHEIEKVIRAELYEALTALADRAVAHNDRQPAPAGTQAILRPIAPPTCHDADRMGGFEPSCAVWHVGEPRPVDDTDPA